MYDRHLESFIITADCGSFLKAAEKMFISSNAITKHINLLEQRLQVKLFHRSARGLSLTDAGKLLYRESSGLIRHCDQVMEEAKQLEEQRRLKQSSYITIRIGVSILNSGYILLKLWQRFSKEYPQIKIEIVPYEDSEEGFCSVTHHFGAKIDLIARPCVNEYWGNTYNTLRLTEIPNCIACAKEHPLASLDEVSFADLHGYSVILSLSNPINRKIQTLLSDVPDITTKTIDDYYIEYFNQIAFSSDLLLTPACYKHPLLKNIPLKESCFLPYGIIYSKKPSKDVQTFIRAISTSMEQNLCFSYKLTKDRI